jgi:hypothetical protein
MELLAQATPVLSHCHNKILRRKTGGRGYYITAPAEQRESSQDILSLFLILWVRNSRSRIFQF